MDAKKLPIAYWCHKCNTIFAGLPRQEHAWIMPDMEEVDRLEVSFSQPIPTTIYSCEDGCRHIIVPSFVHAWECSSCNTIYDSREEAQDCCR